MSIDTVLNKFIDLLHAGEYFEAHEVLEYEWHNLKRENHQKANLARGLINAAVAFEHLKRNTPTAMSKATKTYSGYTKYAHLCDESDGYWHDACKLVDNIAKEKM